MRPTIDELRAALQDRGHLRLAVRTAAEHGSTVDEMLADDRRLHRGFTALQHLLSALGLSSVDALLPGQPPPIPLVLAPCARVVDDFARVHCTCAGCKAARPYRLVRRWDVNRIRARQRYHQLKEAGIWPRCMGPNPRRTADCYECAKERWVA